MTHRYHPDDAHLDREGRPEPDHPDAILFDDCGGCDMNAEHPLYRLDETNLPRMWKRMADVESGRDRAYRSRNEARAARVLYAVGGFLERRVVRDALAQWLAFGESGRDLFKWR